MKVIICQKIKLPDIALYLLTFCVFGVIIKLKDMF